MLWLKRNLLLTVGGFVALALLIVGGWYFWTNRQKSKEIETKLDENKKALTELISGKNPYPGPTNITRAKEELQRASNAIAQARSFFQPVPFEQVTDQAFKAVLDNTIYELHQKAKATSVILPAPGYAFTFEHQKRQLQFPPEAFPALPQQLAEIKVISELLFDARVNKLITFRRARVYAEEPISQVDHHDMAPTVDQAMAMASNPYEIVFHAFSTELAIALASFYKSTNGLIVKSIDISPAPVETPLGNQPGSAQPVTPVPRPAVQPGAAPRVGAAAAAKQPEGPKTVLIEKLLKVTLVLDVLRALPPQNSIQKPSHGLTQTTR
jgi:hypothetical protein